MSTDRFRTALRIGLAMVLAYGVSLWLDWDKSYWAGLAVGMCALATDGESLQKSLLRIVGTVHAVIFTLILLAFFAQDRWAVILILTLHAGFCTYMMGGTRRWYSWFLAAWLTVLLGTLSDSESLRAFHFVTLRSLQTLLGVICYMVVATVILPTNSRTAFETAVRSQVAALRRLIATAVEVQLRGGSDEELQALRREAVQGVARLPALLDSAQLDSFEIWEARREWRSAVALLEEISDSAERWVIAFPELKEYAAGAALDRLAASAAEFDRRLEAIAEMLQDRPPPVSPEPIAMPAVPEDEAGHAHLLRAAATLARSRLREIDRASMEFFQIAADLSGQGPRVAHPREAAMPKLWVPDPDRLRASLRVMAGFVTAYLLYIYVPAMPMYSVLLVQVLVLGMTSSVLTPALNPASVLSTALVACGIGGSAHLFIMPHLDGFLELGAMLFLATFAICWINHRPQQQMARTFGLALFVVLTQIDNDQTYSFTYVADVTIGFSLAVGVAAACRYVPVSYAPHHGLERSLATYAKSSVALMETMRWDRRLARGWLERQRRLFLARRASQSASYLSVWAGALGGGSAASTFAADLDRLHKRLQDWISQREVDQDENVIRELLADMRTWRLAVEEAMGKLADAPEKLSADDLRARLAARLERMEAAVTSAISGTSGTTEVQGEALYNTIGGLRGVSEALILAVETAERVDWPRLRENRF